MIKTSNKKYSAVIFDFNGTLFWDTHLHNIAWNQFFENHGMKFSDDDFFRKVHGKNNRDLLTNLFEGISEEMIQKYIMDKEKLYFELCKERNHNQLAPGAAEFINFLKLNNIPYAIATASGIENIDFYFDYIGIGKWFSREQIVYNNGEIKSKPHPEIYQKAMDLLDIKPEDAIVFEDAVAGLESAQAAQAGKLVVVNSNDDNYKDWEEHQIITHFDQIDRNIFN